jgi:ribose transport system substrate-binding protein
MLSFARLAAFCATLLLVFTASAQVQDKRVALLTNTTVSTWLAGYNSVVKTSLERSGVKTVNWTSPQDPALQSQQVDDAIAQGFDLIVVNSINEVALIPALERAKKANIPVILSVQGLPPGNEKLYVTLVGHDTEAIGRLAAEQLVRALGDKGGKVAVIQGNPAQTQVRMILDGFKKTLANTPKVQLVAVEGKSWRPDEAGAMTRQLMLRFAGQGGLNGIFAMNDSQAAQVVAALESTGKNPGRDVMVVGGACSKEGMVTVKAGKMLATVDINPTTEGELTADTVIRVLKQEKVANPNFMNSVAITSQNVDTYAARCTY